MSRTGLDSHSLYPLNLKPHELLQWALKYGAEGVHFSVLPDSQRENLSVGYLHELGQMARDMGLYIEWGGGRHIPFKTSDWSREDLMPVNMKAAGDALAVGARIIRSCSDSMVRANPENPSTGTLIKATVSELTRMIPMLRDNGVVLAIETNFEFTTYELLKIFKMCEVEPGDCLGICLDTMNLLTMLENPVQAAERVLPWVVCTHIKDGGLIFDKKGLTAFPSPLGSGIIDIEKISAMIAERKPEVNLSVSSHGGSYLLPIHEPWYISQFPNLTISEYNNLMLLEDIAELRMEEGNLAITSDEEWVSVCEVRVTSDLRLLKQISGKFK
jgi:sugar phosphate isomerase/epimerase